MDPVSNPYAPGAGTPPPLLAGRDEDLQRFHVVLERLRLGYAERSPLVTGLRGVGKTVLLNTFREMAVDAGFVVAKREVEPGDRLAPMIARLLRSLLLELDTKRRRSEAVRRALGVLHAFTYTLPADAGTIRIDVEAVHGRADSGDLSADVADLLVEVGRAARVEGAGAVLFLDEMQFLARPDLAALIGAVHQASQEQLPVTVVGAGLPQLVDRVGHAKSYAERLFVFTRIDALPDDAARMALVGPASRLGVEIEPPAADRALELSGGYPFFLQEYGRTVWNIAPASPVTLPDVVRAEPEVERHLDAGFFSVRLGRTTEGERDYLRAMAEVPPPRRSGEIAARLGRKVTSVAPTRAQLIDKGLVYSPAYGENEFTVPNFDRFLVRRYPVFPIDEY